MHKSKALILGILCSATAILALADTQMMLMVAFAAGAILFLGIFLYKYQRDRSIIVKAQLERQASAQTSLVKPPHASKGSRRLFVPPSVK